MAKDLLYVSHTSYFIQRLNLRCQCSGTFLNTQLTMSNEHRDIQCDVKTFRSCLKTATNIIIIFIIFGDVLKLMHIPNNLLPFDDDLSPLALISNFNIIY